MSEKASFNIQPIRFNSEDVNFRRIELDYVRKEWSQFNEYWTECTIAEKMEVLKVLVKEKSGQKMQKRAEPIKEAVVNIKETTTMNDLKRLGEVLKEKYNISVFQIGLHRDLGHYDKITKEWIPNSTANMVFDWINHNTGKTIRLNRWQCSDIQTDCAEVLGLERTSIGNPRHYTALQYKIQKLEEEQQKLADFVNVEVLDRIISKLYKGEEEPTKRLEEIRLLEKIREIGKRMKSI